MTARGRGGDALITLGVTLLYIGCAKLGLALAVSAAQVSAVWPPTGFALAVVVLLGRRAVPGVLLGAFISNATADEPLWVAAGIALGNTAEAMFGAAFLRRYRFDAALARLRDVLVFLAAAALSPVVSATIGVAFLTLGGVHPLHAAPALWPVWWVGDALGALVVAPLILAWSRGDRLWRTRGIVEPASMIVGLIVVGTIIFSLPPSFPAGYMVYPFFIWAAMRLGPAYATTASVIANAIAVAGTLMGHGPFVGFGPERGLVLVQAFIAVGATTALILGAIAAQSRATHERAEVSEYRLRMAMSGARLGVWEWNILTGELAWSAALEPLHGLTQGGFTGTFDAFLDLIHPEDRERVEKSIRESVASHQPYRAEFRLQGADGVVRWTNARGVVLEDKEGRAVRMIGVGIDVTEQKQLEDDLRLQHRRKDEFLAMLGHELRNPLAAIVHAMDALSSPDANESGEALRVIHRQTTNLSRLVDDLLDVSRITQGKIHLDRRPVTISEVINAAVAMWRHLIAQNDQQLTIDIPTEPVWVDGDPTRLTQIFANLVQNAAKFTAKRGTIAIAVSQESGHAVVRVRDNGAGMELDVLAHAFELFVQGPRALDRQQGGLGLGLTLVKRLTEMHGGTVEARSGGARSGTEIVVRLPLVAAPEATAAVPESKAPARVQPRRVLVVEDNGDARRMLVYILERDGHKVRAAGDGHEAIAEAESFAPEVALIDIGLPGIDGYAVARALRGSPYTAESLLIALTGYGQDSDREKAFAAGFDLHLLKPADAALVREAIRQGRAGREAGTPVARLTSS